ncbi:MAG: aminotransferase class I/II-fold pyridoxal phosphate-dependent enzyme, partial [Armatimonadetes bacterium]|nr:aminotransferase class I/II-fold pyridoxal phosphate-dependent enzyme [Anaerolineae bacterium]
AEICLKHNVLMVSDEIHCDLILDADKTHVPLASLSPEISARTLTLMAPSKTFNLAGLGCAFGIVQDPDLRATLQKAAFGHLPFVNVMGFAGALAAYQHGADWLAALLPYLRANRDYVYDFVAQNLPGVRATSPEGTYLAWLDCRETGITDPYTFFLETAKVGFSDGKDFGKPGEGFVRLNFGTTRATLTEALTRVQNALTTYQADTSTARIDQMPQ